MTDMTIKTNRHWRAFCYRNEVPAEILANQFDWLDPEDGGLDGFFKYRGWWYHTSEFMAVRGLTEAPMCDWDGYHGDSYFSGIVVRFSRDGEQYMVGTYMS